MLYRGIKKLNSTFVGSAPTKKDHRMLLDIIRVFLVLIIKRKNKIRIIVLIFVIYILLLK